MKLHLSHLLLVRLRLFLLFWLLLVQYHPILRHFLIEVKFLFTFGMDEFFQVTDLLCICLLILKLILLLLQALVQFHQNEGVADELMQLVAIL